MEPEQHCPTDVPGLRYPRSLTGAELIGVNRAKSMF